MRSKKQKSAADLVRENLETTQKIVEETNKIIARTNQMIKRINFYREFPHNDEWHLAKDILIEYSQKETISTKDVKFKFRHIKKPRKKVQLMATELISPEHLN